QAVVPGGVGVLAQEGHAAQPGRLRPEVVGRFHPGRVGADGLGVGYAGAVVHAVADHRPAVVLARLGQVQLVAGARAVFAFPQPAGERIDCQALHVAVAVTVDFSVRAGAADEGVVGGNAAVQVQPHQLALEHGQVLRAGAVVALALADERVAFAIEGDARAEVGPAAQLGCLAVNHAQSTAGVVVESRDGGRGAGGAVGPRFGIGQPDPPRLGEV